MSRYSIFLILFLITLSGKTQTLSELVSLALQENPELQALHYDYEALLQVEEQVGYLPDPELSAGWFLLPVETRLGAQQVRVGATQSFPWKGTLAARRAVALNRAWVSNTSIARRQLKLILDLEQAYYHLTALRADRIELDSSLQILKSWEQLALTKVAAGSASNADVLEVRLRIREVEQMRDNLDRATIAPRALINQVLSRDADTEVRTPEMLALARIPYQQDSVLAMASRVHPDILWLEAQQQLASQQIESNELARKPSFAVGLDYILVSGRNDATPVNNGRDIIGLRAGMKIPINGERFDAKTREEQLKISALENRKIAYTNIYARVLAQAYARYDQAYSDYQFYQEQLEFLQSTIDILLSKYSSEGNGFDRILMLENQRIQYQRKIIQAVRDSHLAASEINQYIPR